MKSFQDSGNSQNRINIWGLFNFLKPGRPNSQDSDPQLEASLALDEDAIFKQAVAFERHTYHQRQVRHYRQFRAKLGYFFAACLLIAGVSLFFTVAQALVYPGDYQDWRNYLSGAYIDATSAVETEQIYVYPKMGNYIDLGVEVSIPYAHAQSLADTNPAMSIVVLVECPDGVLRYFKLNREEIQDYLAREAYFPDYAKPYQATYIINYQYEGGLRSIPFRFHQQLTLMFHLRANWSIAGVYLLALITILLLTQFLDTVCECRIREHKYYCASDEDLGNTSSEENSESDATDADDDDSSDGPNDD